MAISTEGLPTIARNPLSSRSELVKTINEISSGSKLNKADGEGASVATASQLTAEVASLNAARSNTVSAVAAVRVADGGVQSSSEALIRIRELAVQGSSSTLSDGARGAIQKELKSLVDLVDKISNTTEFNGTPLLNGEAGDLTFQVGPNSGPDNQVTFATPDVGVEALGLESASVENPVFSQNLIESADAAMATLGTVQAELGATETTLATAHDGASGELISKQSALSNIRDTGMASASTNLAQELVLAQAQVAMRAQSNASVSVTSKLLG